MATKKKNPVAPADNQGQNAAEPQPSPAPRKQRQAAPMQPDLAVEVEKCKKHITSIKALNKLAPVISSMDDDALDMVSKLVESRRVSLGQS